MADQQNTPIAEAEPTVLTRPNGTSYVEEQFSLAKTKEVAARFQGEHKLTYRLPVAVPGNIQATLANLQEFVSPEADFATVLVDKFNGQGLRLDVQKHGKNVLGPQAKDDVTLETAQEAMLGYRLGQPRAKTERKAREGKLQAAEKKAQAATLTAVEMFRALPRAARKQFGPQMVATGVLQQEELDQILAEG